MRALILVLLISFFSSGEILAAGMGSGPPAPCGGPFPPCPVPVDNGVWALLAAAIVFTAYKIFKSRKALRM